ncbi:serine/threonine protein kinase [Edaphobacter modestus]|uniref:Serine/threonine-protein kinase n=1 Tax=Edaphobacter modestus TaxID=388466 RepID=A0A4Q7YP04_9BACT|nr:serine/threonine-protein kinase [Edaphobacter modestus]RZU39150.1 serine/threonine-protein kinase [Edaphobacter modestus]
MKSDRWSLIEEIFQSALERPPAERKQYVEMACENDKELLSEIESLLENDDDAERVLRSLIADDLKNAGQMSDLSETGLQLGPYHLVRELDSGGMGIVYLAVRSDDHYFQVVAIKMIRKANDSPELVHRFRRERQILATLNHPCIGTILDGGETQDGRPFIVMEYVEGQPITLASKSRGLSIRQRIELFRSVCSAVHYAHQKLIIHRDIKPSNVMVTPDGMVKLIDFGISTPLAPELVLSDSSPTATSLRRMTPDYASPEQIQGKHLTTATDIYSLGVLLFELLTGSRPYTLSNLSAVAADRVVSEQNGKKPSSAPGMSSSARKELSGDLDRIVLKATDLDPSQRYLSVQHLDEDLLRYLTGKPISARTITPTYVLSKFVQRHRVAALTACTIAIALSCLLLLYLKQSRSDDRRVKEVRTLADSAISDMADKLQHSSASTETQAALFRSALSYLGELRQTIGNDPRLLLELSKAYVRVGDLEGSPLVANLGNSDTAVTTYREASRTAIEAHAHMPGDESTQAVIETYQRLGGIELFLGNLHESNDNYQQALTWARNFWRQKPDEPIRKRLLATSYAGIGDVSLGGLNPDKALENYSMAFQVFGNSPIGVEDHDRMLIGFYLGKGSTLNELGKQSEALENNRKGVALAEALVQRFPASLPARRALFLAYEDLILPLAGRDALNVSDSSQAQVYARKALAIAQMLVGVDSKNAQAQFDLARAYTSMGDAFRQSNPHIASIWYRKSIGLTKQLSPLYGSGARHWLAIQNEALAEVLVKEEDGPERLRLLQEANLVRQELAETSPHGLLHLMRSYCKLSDAELAVKGLTKARQYANAALPFLDKFNVTSPSLLVLRDLGFCFESDGAVQHHIAMDRKLPSAERLTAEAESRRWYSKSADVWSTWNQREAATPESEHERHKVETFLKRSGTVPQQAVANK